MTYLYNVFIIYLLAIKKTKIVFLIPYHNTMTVQTIQEFLTHTECVLKQSKSTLKQHRQNLHDFFRFLSYQKAEFIWSDVTLKDVADYITQVSTKKTTKSSKYYGERSTISASTLANYIKSIVAFFKWMDIYGDKCLDYRKIPKIKVVKPRPETMTVQEVKKYLLIPEAVETRRDIALRNKLYIAMLYVT